MGAPALREDAPGSSTIRCDLCHRPFKSIYHVQFDGIPYKFCSGLHVGMAQKNFEAHKEAGDLPEHPEDTKFNHDDFISEWGGEE